MGSGLGISGATRVLYGSFGLRGENRASLQFQRMVCVSGYIVHTELSLRPEEIATALPIASGRTAISI